MIAGPNSRLELLSDYSVERRNRRDSRKVVHPGFDLSRVLNHLVDDFPPCPIRLRVDHPLPGM